MRFGYLLSMQFNTNRGEKQKPLQPWDFFGSLKDLERPVDNRAEWLMFAERIKHTQKEGTETEEE